MLKLFLVVGFLLAISMGIQPSFAQQSEQFENLRDIQGELEAEQQERERMQRRVDDFQQINTPYEPDPEWYEPSNPYPQGSDPDRFEDTNPEPQGVIVE